MTFSALAAEYGAVHFRAALARFVVQVTEPDLTSRQLEDMAVDVILPFQSVAVFHKIRYNIINNDGTPNNLTVDSIHARLARHDHHRRNVPARFDTALVNLGNGGPLGVEGRYGPFFSGIVLTCQPAIRILCSAGPGRVFPFSKSKNSDVSQLKRP